MAKARSPNRDKALNLYIEHNGNITNREISEILKENEKTISNWKCRDKWNVVLRKGECSTTKKRGGQIGNKNSVGSGAPKGNKNNRKHGLYENVYWDTLEKDEIEMLEQIDFDDDESNLKDQLRLLTVRERRLLKSIEEHKNKKGGLTLESVAKRKLEIEGNLIKDDTQIQTETITKTTSVFDVIHRLEAELTKVQSKKTKCIESLYRIKSDKQKVELAILKLELEVAKESGNIDEEIEDDGFIKALSTESESVWGEEDE
ncbi:phage terminase small subunit [Clostridioides sp. ES-W-0016-02]|uniref:phage terminase small subunit n=1 Tax=Clostridioides sp. ES-W-0016-02 TaxID=2770788 RepID=UPI001D11A7BB|nr:terminase [Clostridioides sp. ES-W-0016-02]